MNLLSRKHKYLYYFIVSVLLLSSCNKDNLDDVTEIKLTIKNNLFEQYKNSPFIFMVEGDNKKDITKDAELIINDTLIISDNKFASPVVGTFAVTAKYKDLTSNTLNVKVVIPGKYEQKVLIEDFTATWCVNCPRVAHAIHEAKKTSDRVVAVSIHRGDFLECNESKALEELSGESGYPIGMINRIQRWSSNEDKHLDEVLSKTGSSAPLGLAISSEIIDNKIQLETKVGFDTTITKPLGIVIYLIENKIIGEQENNTPYYDHKGLIEDFEHNDVLRTVYTNIEGDIIPKDKCVKANVYLYSLEKEIPNNVLNRENLHIVSFVVNKDTKEVLNAQESKVGENKNFN